LYGLIAQGESAGINDDSLGALHSRTMPHESAFPTPGLPLLLQSPL
jgi:hypothetical protein